MDLNTLIDRTGLPRRLVRYVVDHDLVGFGKILSQGDAVGRARRFADDVGIGIALAAYMLQAGLKRDLVVRILETLPDIYFKEKDGSFDTPVLPSLIVRPIPATLEILDAKHVRFTSDVVGHPWHSEWWSLESHKPVSSPDSEGLLRIQIDFGKIRDQIIKPAGNISESTETP